jgi:hypothetical protein
MLRDIIFCDVSFFKQETILLTLTPGVPQANILGSIFFTLFINDLPDDISSVCNIFADDTKIYSCTSHSQTIQKDLDNLVNWSDKWNLYFNAGKCKVLHYG